jgi:hypothetical protein
MVRYRARGVVRNISLFLSGLLVAWGADEPTPPVRRGAPMNEADRLMIEELTARYHHEGGV